MSACGRPSPVVYWSREATLIAPPLLALALAAESPSFDCTKARTADERLVCSDADLARQDRELAAKKVKASGAKLD